MVIIWERTVLQNPYRFVFLDGCKTATGNFWPAAFGILPLSTNVPNNTVGPGPQAFVGWGGDSVAWTAGIMIPYLAYTLQDKSVELAWSYSQTLADFYSEWQEGEDTLATCIANASHADQYGQAPLSVPPNRKFRCYSNGGGPPGYEYFSFNARVSYPAPLYVIGHSGLKRYGYNQADDGKYARPN